MSSIAVYNSFVNGMNDTVAPDNTLDTELRLCINGIVNKRGGIKRRKGCTKLNAVSYGAEINQLIEWPLSDGNTKLLAMVGNDLCLIAEDGTKTVKIAALNSTTIAYVVYQEMFYFIDGLNYYVWGFFKFNSSDETQTIALDDIVKNDLPSSGGGVEGHFYKAKAGAVGSINLSTIDFSNVTNWTDVTDGVISNDIRTVVPNSDVTNDLAPIKRCKYIVWHPSSYRFFAAGDQKNPTALYYSEAGTPNYFKKVSKLFPTTALGPIDSIVDLVDSLCVGYKNGWRRWTGIDVSIAVWKPIAIPDGVDANDGIALTPNSLTYLSREGLSSFHVSIINNDYVNIPSSEVYSVISQNKIEGIIKSMVHKETVKAVFDDGIYYLAYGDDALNPKNNKALFVDWETKGIVVISGWQVNGWCKRLNGDLLFASKNYILKAFDGLNDVNVETGLAKGVALSGATKQYKLGNAAQAFYPKYVSRFFVSAQQPLTDHSYLKMEVISDYLTSDIDQVDFSESLIWNRDWNTVWGFKDLINQEVLINKSGLRHQVIFYDDSMDTELFIYGFGFEYDYSPVQNAVMPSSTLINDSYYST